MGSDDEFPIFECSSCEGRGEIPDEELVDGEGYPIMLSCDRCGASGVEP